MRPIFDLQSAFTAEIRQAEVESSKMFEPAIGIVTDNKDPEKLGRVKVKIPVLSGEDSSWWCPLVMPGAGKNRGWFFIPEVDDEVLVLFEHGDMQRPMIIGALWGGKDKPPEKNDGKNERRMIKSRQGNTILFDDDKKKIIIEDGKQNARITFDSEGKKITIEALKEDVCFQAPMGEMSIVAKTITADAQKNIEIHAGSNMQLGAGSTATVKASTVATSGATAGGNCGSAQMPPAATAQPKDVEDPFGS